MGGTALREETGGRPVLPGLSADHGSGAGCRGNRQTGTATPCWGRKGTQQKLERMRCAAAAQLKREDVLRQLARLAFGRVDDAVTAGAAPGRDGAGGTGTVGCV